MICADDARFWDGVCYDLILSDSNRSLQRSLINLLFNGEPPYSEEEVQKNQVRINVNKLTAPTLGHNSRIQYFNGFMNQDRFFTASTDWGPVHKRDTNRGIVTREANRILKDDIQYFESKRSDFASLTLHGIAPGAWENMYSPIPRPMGVEDVLVPARTLLDFSNLPFFVFRRAFTGMELEEFTRAEKRDPGWNLPYVERCLAWLDRQMTQLVNNNWPETLAFEKWVALRKEQGGMFATDQCPVVDTFDIYIYREAHGGQPAGWVRRILLDSWSNPGFTPAPEFKYLPPTRRSGRMDADGRDIDSKKAKDKNGFLYTSGDRTVGASRQEIVKFQFADLSAVAPSRYHEVKSLGWLCYAQCHLENRIYCKTLEAGFETLMQLFQVDNMDDVQNALKMELANFAVIDKSLKPIPQTERWQPNVQLVELITSLNSNLIQTNSQSWTSSPTQQPKKERETNFQRMADLQQMNALVSAGISQAYQYARWEYMEIFRRLMLPGERSPESRKFRMNCLRQGVPEKLLVAEAWDIQTERMIGGGNQTLEMMIAQQLLELMPKFEPGPQRIVLRNGVQAITKNPQLALELVPENPVKITSATHDAELAAGSLLQGIPVEPLTGMNVIEYTEQMLKILAMRVQKGMQQGGMVDAKELQGLQAIAQNIAQHIQIIAQDEEEKERVKKYGDILGKLVNEIKAFAQRLQQAMKKQAQQNGNGQIDPKDKGKLVAQQAQSQQKLQMNAQRHQQKMDQDNAKFMQGLQHEALQAHADLASKDLETAASIRRGMFEDDANDQTEAE
jgi:hypothetical protein